MSGDYPFVAPAAKCLHLARPEEDADPLVWEEFYRRSAECPWIHRNGIEELSKSPKEWEAALEVVTRWQAELNVEMSNCAQDIVSVITDI
jgi:hypothetical protein